MTRLTAVLSPAVAPRNRFWERSEVIRYFGNELRRWFTLECALVETLGGRLAPADRVQLAKLQSALERVGVALMSDGQPTSGAVPLGILARRQLQLARCWCAELESATAGLRESEVPPATRALLERLAR